MVMRIEMRRCTAQQRLKLIELLLQGIAHRGRIFGIKPARALIVAEMIEMQTDSEIRKIATDSGGFAGGGTRDHHAGAGHDATRVRIDDPAIHTARDPEVVGVHDDVSQRLL
jgi:hypothetical protein